MINALFKDGRRASAPAVCARLLMPIMKAAPADAGRGAIESRAATAAVVQFSVARRFALLSNSSFIVGLNLSTATGITPYNSRHQKRNRPTRKVKVLELLRNAKHNSAAEPSARAVPAGSGSGRPAPPGSIEKISARGRTAASAFVLGMRPATDRSEVSIMTTEPDRARDEARIRALIDQQAKALRAKDATGVQSHYAADTVKFDLAPPLQYAGVDALDERASRVVFVLAQPLGYEFGISASPRGGSPSAGFVRISGTGRRRARRCHGRARPSACGRSTAHGRSRTARPCLHMDGSYRRSVDLEP
jgi:hypothetical protein